MGWIRRTAAVGLVTTVLAAGATASAATTSGIGVFAPLAGTANEYTTTMQLPGTGYPLADVTSDSRAGGVGVQSGASTWFGANSTPGRRFGSSRDQGYLNLRPKADTAASPSRTVYTFARPAPTGWGFVLGDIDADEVRVSARLADGAPATTAELGFENVFNLCDTSPRPSGCSSTQAKDTPTWDPDTATLTGNTAADDTYGAAGWFVPRVRLRSLTFVFTRRAGLPVYQTWFAARAQDVTGTVAVSDGTCALDGVRLHLLDADGTEVATTAPGAGGTYSFDQVAASAGFTVGIDGLPADCLPDGPTSRAVDLRTSDDTADFSIHQVVPGTGTVAGHVTEAASGESVPGASIEVTGPQGYDETRTSDTDGSYTFPDVPPGTYTIELTAPPGTEVVGSDQRSVTITGAGETFPAEDFTVRPAVVPGAVAGHVEDVADQPVAGARVEVSGPDSFDTTVTTGDDGGYSVPDLPPGDYTALLTPLGGAKVVGDRRRSFTVTGDGATITVDFTVGVAPALSGGSSGGSASSGTTSGATNGVGARAAALPDTGGVDLLWVYGAAGLLLAGAGCLLVARRRTVP